MKSTDLAELLLVRLYELARKEGRYSLHTLSVIASEFGVTDKSQVFSVGSMLEDRGLIYATFTHETEVHASIKAEGEMLVEQGGETGIIQTYKHHPSLLVVDESIHFHGPVAHSNVAARSDNVTQTTRFDIHRVLDLVDNTIAEDSTLSPEAKKRAWTDVELIRTEIEREAPREGILHEALATLGDIASVTSLVAHLSDTLLSQ